MNLDDDGKIISEEIEEILRTKLFSERRIVTWE